MASSSALAPVSNTRLFGLDLASSTCANEVAGTNVAAVILEKECSDSTLHLDLQSLESESGRASQE